MPYFVERLMKGRRSEWSEKKAKAERFSWASTKDTSKFELPEDMTPPLSFSTSTSSRTHSFLPTKMLKKICFHPKRWWLGWSGYRESPQNDDTSALLRENQDLLSQCIQAALAPESFPDDAKYPKRWSMGMIEPQHDIKANYTMTLPRYDSLSPSSLSRSAIPFQPPRSMSHHRSKSSRFQPHHFYSLRAPARRSTVAHSSMFLTSIPEVDHPLTVEP